MVPMVFQDPPDLQEFHQCPLIKPMLSISNRRTDRQTRQEVLPWDHDFSKLMLDLADPEDPLDHLDPRDHKDCRV